MPKTKLHTIVSEQMRKARQLASSQEMSREEFVAQTPRQQRVLTKAGLTILDKLDDYFKSP